MMLPPDEASAPADAAAADARVPATLVPTTPTPYAATKARLTASRTDLAEVRRLRHRLLQLILENQHRRDDQRRRGLSVRGAV